MIEELHLTISPADGSGDQVEILNQELQIVVVSSSERQSQVETLEGQIADQASNCPALPNDGTVMKTSIDALTQTNDQLQVNFQY